MIMGISWRDDLAIGIESIDNQHRELIARFDALLTACRDGNGGPELLRLIIFLDDYVVTHFRDEERLQRKVSYPEYEQHRQQHAGFVKRLHALKSQLSEDTPPALSQILSTNNMLLDWLLKHISSEDQAMGRFIHLNS
jgi:hemerythrin